MSERKVEIVCTEGTVSGSPRVKGTRVRVSDVVESYQELGWSLEKIADQYSLDIEEVLEALRYYYQNPKYQPHIGSRETVVRFESKFRW